MGSQAAQQEPAPLEGKFKELWDKLDGCRNGGNEALVTPDAVAGLATDLGVTEQYVFDTIRKFEGRSMLRRSRKGNAILLTFRDGNQPAPDGKTDNTNPPAGGSQPLRPPIKREKLQVVSEYKRPEQKQGTAQIPHLKLTEDEAKMPLKDFVVLLESDLQSLDEDIQSLKFTLSKKQNLRGQKAFLLASLKEYLP